MYPSRKNPNLRTTLKQIEKVLKAITIWWNPLWNRPTFKRYVGGRGEARRPV
jgi:hypothetical protein